MMCVVTGDVIFKGNIGFVYDRVGHLKLMSSARAWAIIHYSALEYGRDFFRGTQIVKDNLVWI